MYRVITGDCGFQGSSQAVQSHNCKVRLVKLYCYAGNGAAF